MAVKTKTFIIFGREYKTVQYAAVPALEIMANSHNMRPEEILRQTWAKDSDGHWVQLDAREPINAHVVGSSGTIPPRMVLQALLKAVNEFSFGFVSGWQGVKVPRRFTEGSEPRESQHADPLIATLFSEHVASLRELEEYYSLEDAFKMFDVLVAKGVNAALANEAAMKSNR
jgi:hypothetical protein